VLEDLVQLVYDLLLQFTDASRKMVAHAQLTSWLAGRLKAPSLYVRSSPVLLLTIRFSILSNLIVW
jgi:hypothetical protein